MSCSEIAVELWHVAETELEYAVESSFEYMKKHLLKEQLVSARLIRFKLENTFPQMYLLHLYILLYTEDKIW
jgi:hypothetical protein